MWKRSSNTATAGNSKDEAPYMSMSSPESKTEAFPVAMKLSPEEGELLRGGMCTSYRALNQAIPYINLNLNNMSRGFGLLSILE